MHYNTNNNNFSSASITFGLSGFAPTNEAHHESLGASWEGNRSNKAAPVCLLFAALWFLQIWLLKGQCQGSSMNDSVIKSSNVHPSLTEPFNNKMKSKKEWCELLLSAARRLNHCHTRTFTFQNVLGLIQVVTVCFACIEMFSHHG